MSSGIGTVRGRAAAPHAAIGRRLMRGSIVALGVYITGAGLTYGAQLAIARLVGAQAFGIYAYVLAWCTVLAYVAALGFDVSMLRLVPAYGAQGRLDLLRGVARYAHRRVAAVGAVLAMGGMGLALLLRTPENAALTTTFVLGLPLVPVWALLWMKGSMVRGFGGVADALVPDRIVRDGTLLLLTVGAVLLLGEHLGAPGAMAMTLTGSLAGLLLVSWALRRRTPAALATVPRADDAATWRRIAAPLVMMSVAEAMQNRVGVLILGWVGETRDAGIYALAFTLAMAVMLPRTAINALFAPMIAEIHARDDRSAMQFLVTRSALWTLLSGLAVALPLAALAGPILTHFGAGFASGRLALQILLFGQVFAAAAGPQQFLMTMTGHERAGAVLIVGSVVVNTAAAWLLIGPFGIAGAAAATAGAMVLWNVAMGVFVARRLRLIPGVLGAAALPAFS